MKRKIFRLPLLAALILLPLLGCHKDYRPPYIQTTPALTLSLQHGAQAQHWFEEYPPSVRAGSLALSQQNYDNPFLAPGMSDIANSAFVVLQQSLSPSENTQLQGWSITQGACSTSGPHILLVKQPAVSTGGHLCVASFLISSLFLQNANESSALQKTQEWFVRWGIDPMTFSGQYHLELLSKRVDQDSWNAIVGVATTVYDAYLGSVYFLVAYQMERVLLPNASPADLDKAAFVLVRKADAAFGVMAIVSLVRLLQDLNQTSPETWGYSVPGDGQDEVTRLTSLAQTLPQ